MNALRVGAVTDRNRTAARSPIAHDLQPAALGVRRLQHVFEATVNRTPDAVAVESDGTTLSYAELDRRANQLAHHLRDRGIGGGTRVAILLHRSFETYVTLLGVGKAGAAFVPIDPASPLDRIAYIAADADADLLLTSRELSAGAEGLRCPVLEIDACADALRRPRAGPISAATTRLTRTPLRT